MGKPRRYHGEWFPREVPLVLNVLPRNNIEGSLRNFLKASPWPHPRPDQRPKPPRGLWPLGFLAFRKFLGEPSIFSLGSTLSTLGKLPWGSIHHATSSAFPQIVPLWCRCRHAQTVRDSTSSYKKGLSKSLRPLGHQNPISGS